MRSPLFLVNFKSKIFVLALVLSSLTFGMELLPEDIQCEEVTFNKEVRVFRDPELFREGLKMLAEDAESARLHFQEDGPLLTTRKGRIKICYGKPQPFRNYRKLLSVYPKELYLPLTTKNEIPNILLVRFPEGSGAYSNYLGFVFASEFRKALEETNEGGTPPSLKFIPKLLKKD